MNKVHIRDLQILKDTDTLIAFSDRSVIGLIVNSSNPYALDLASHIDNITALEVE
jgi:hypothetical protein